MSTLKEYFNERFNEKVWYDDKKAWEEDKKKMKKDDEDQSGYCTTKKMWWIMWDQIKDSVKK